MEKNLSVQSKKASKQHKVATKSNNNNKQLKVVYISNPMKVETSPSEFRALVQELTGQDAEDLPEPSKISAGKSSGSGGKRQVAQKAVAAESSDLSAAEFEAPLIEDLPAGMIMPSNMWYD